MLSDTPPLSWEVYIFSTSRGTSGAIRGEMRDMNEGVHATSLPSGGWTTGSRCSIIFFPQNSVIEWPEQLLPVTGLLSYCLSCLLISSFVKKYTVLFDICFSPPFVDKELQYNSVSMTDCWGALSEISIEISKVLCYGASMRLSWMFLWQHSIFK